MSVRQLNGGCVVRRCATVATAAALSSCNGGPDHGSFQLEQLGWPARGFDAGTIPDGSVCPSPVREDRRFEARALCAFAAGAGAPTTLGLLDAERERIPIRHVIVMMQENRVPLVVISRWARRHYVSHVRHEHTSITRLIELLFDLPAMTARDANSDALLDMFNFGCSSPAPIPDAPEAGTGGCVVAGAN